MFHKLTFFCILSLCLATSTNAQDWSKEEQQVINAIGRLSASTAPDGGGADAYGEMLTDDFSRWTVGSSQINYKKEWVEGIREWFDEGWRVSDRKVDFLEITIQNNLAFTRRNVEETYLGPDGDTSVSKAAVAETWIKTKEDWLLLRVNVHPILD